MLQSNRLHKKFELRNLFRTFSRAYSRKYPQSLNNTMGGKTISLNSQSILQLSSKSSIKLKTNRLQNLRQMDRTSKQQHNKQLESNTKLKQNQYSIQKNTQSLPLHSFCKQKDEISLGQNELVFNKTYFQSNRDKNNDYAFAISLKSTSNKQGFNLKLCRKGTAIRYDEFDRTDFSLIELKQKQKQKQLRYLHFKKRKLNH